MSLTNAEAQGITNVFLRDYPGALVLGYRFRNTAAELYGEPNSLVPPDMKGGYISLPLVHAGRNYLGRVDIALDNVSNVRDLLLTLRHEVLGHFGTNTFTPPEKRALLDGLIAARNEPSLKPLWDDIDRRYAEHPLDIRAEEVYALHCEGLAPIQHELANTVQRGMQAFQETCVAPVRTMTAEDLQSISAMVAQGVRERSRTQQTFPGQNYPDSTDYPNAPDIPELLRKKDAPADPSPKKPLHETVAENLIAQLEAGTAPWQRPWNDVETSGFMPVNAVTGQRYRGMNAMHLLSRGRPDPRWLTYIQANSVGAQVRRGERGTQVQFWKYEDLQARKDQNGNPILDAAGDPVMERVRLETPRVFTATVFNAAQVDGLPVVQTRRDWDPVAHAETILQASGALIRHIPGERAFYDPIVDQIVLPDRSQFDSPGKYYASALHELGHWTGHPSRLSRDLSHPFRSEGYAKEELRAEIASLILSSELGIEHDPAQHAAYVGSWIKVLQKDPREIFAAASDAEKIYRYLMGLAPEVQQEIEASQQASQQASQNLVPAVPPSPTSSSGPAYGIPSPTPQPAAPKEAIMVSYSIDVISEALTYISPNKGRDEWVRIGMAIKSEFPGEDGQAVFDQWSSTGDSYTPQSASSTWKSIKAAGGVTLATLIKEATDNGWKPPRTQAAPETPAQRAARAAQEAQTAAERATRIAEEAQKAQAAQAATAQLAEQLWNAAATTGESAYLQRKGVQGYGTRIGVNNELLVPLVDETGKLHNLQRIYGNVLTGSNTDKLFLKDGRKSGLFHVIGQVEPQKPLLLAEGYATAASLHEATNWPVVVSFDAANLVRVAGVIRAKYPEQLLVVCADDDRENQQRSGTNAGLEKATQAASQSKAVLALPEGLQQGGSDFNDLVAQAGPEPGLQQIRLSLQHALEAKQPAMDAFSPPMRSALQSAREQLGATLQASPNSPRQLHEKLGDTENAFRAATGDGFEALTQPEAPYLTNNQQPDTLGTRIVAEGNAARQSENQADSERSPGLTPGAAVPKPARAKRNRKAPEPAAQAASPAEETGSQASLLTPPGPPGELPAEGQAAASPATATQQAQLTQPGEPSGSDSQADGATPWVAATPPGAAALASAKAAEPESTAPDFQEEVIARVAENLRQGAEQAALRQDAQPAAPAQPAQPTVPSAAAPTPDLQAVLNTVSEGGPELVPQPAGSQNNLDAVLKKLADQYQFDGDSKYYLRGEVKGNPLAFEVKRSLLNKINRHLGRETFIAPHNDPQVCRSIAELAIAKGWKSISIRGSEEFRAEMWKQASLQGLYVYGYDPKPIDLVHLKEQQALQAMDQAAQKQAAQNLQPASEATPATTNPGTNPAVAATQSAAKPANAPVSLSTEAATQIDKQLRAVLQASGANQPEAVERTLQTLYQEMQSPRAYLGELIAHGAAPYQWKDGEAPSYYVTLRTNQGEKTIWGVDLGRAMEPLGSQGQGEQVLLAFQGSKPVEVSIPDRDSQGRITGNRRETVLRNTWYAKSVREAYQDTLTQAAPAPADPAAPSPAPIATRQEQNLRILERAMQLAGVPPDIALATLQQASLHLQNHAPLSNAPPSNTPFQGVRLAQQAPPTRRLAPVTPRQSIGPRL